MGYPNMFHRFCCGQLKEYKVYDKVVMGVRTAESIKRSKRYSEPTECKYYGKRQPENHIEAIYPILDWTDDDIIEYINDRHIRLHPLYYREDGTIDPKRRLGCIACPLKYYKSRIEQFREYPMFVKAWLTSGQKFRDTHPNSTCHRYADVYEWFYRDLFFTSQAKFQEFDNSILGKPDYKQLLEDFFHIDLTLRNT